MKVLIFDSAHSASVTIANRLIETVKSNANPVLGLATGGTVEPVYRKMVSCYAKGEVSFEATRTFNLDEYVGLSVDHPMSYHAYMKVHLFGLTDFSEGNINIPKGDAIDPVSEANLYESKINNQCKIDCQLLGIGENGHVGFNEPTSSLGSVTRIKTLAPETVEANRRYFDRVEDVPRQAITMGIATIMRSKAIVLLATGTKKAKAVAEMIEGPVSANCPASILQFHPAAEIYLDLAAARELKLRDYYQSVHPNGKELML